MSNLECVNDRIDELLEGQSIEPGEEPSVKPKRLLFYGFGFTTVVGLALAGWYVGGRIQAAEQTPGAASSAIVSTNEPARIESTVQAAQSVKPAAPAVARVLPPPETFLEVAGLGPEEDDLYVKKLRAKGFRARVEVDSSQDVRRILIGPFEGKEPLEKAERKLQRAGILALERAQ